MSAETIATASASRSARLRLTAASVARALLALYGRQQQRARLQDLDDHLLRDLGLTRDQAVAESRMPFWR